MNLQATGDSRLLAPCRDEESPVTMVFGNPLGITLTVNEKPCR
jgi:hypothetical protein